MSLANRLAQNFLWLRRSSNVRLSLVLAALFAAGMTIAVLVAIALGTDAFERRVDATLEAIARGAALEGARGDTFGIVLRTPDDLSGLPRSFARAVARGGGTVELEDSFRQSETWRVLVSIDSAGAPIVAAVPLDDGEDALELLSGILWVTVLSVIGIALVIGVMAGALAQRRLKRISVALDDLAAGNLGARTGVDRSKDDLDDIARQVDETADALERLVAQTRTLSASIAHDLRTPLARLRSRLESLPEGKNRGAALEEAERLSAMFDTIMRVARIEAGQGTKGFEQVDLGALIEDLTETYEPVVDDAKKSLVADISDPETVLADRAMLVQAIANLIQNAVRHGGNRITILAQGRSIGVADNGTGVALADIEEITKPMVRLDAARKSEGAGLGLALVRAVADRHGAELQIAQNVPTGLSVLLNFAKS